jgi:CRP-like cAMP-binding protein
VLVQAGESPAGVFYVTSGRVTQYDISGNGTNIVVNTFKSAAFFPMSWAINDTHNNYFFEATTKVTAHMAPAKDVVAFLHDNPDVTFDLLSRVFRGSDGLLRRMAHLMGGDAKTRLLFELLNAAHRFGESQANGTVFVPLKEVDMAKHSGLARETVNRTVQTLKAAGLIEIRHNGFILQDLAKLEAALGSDI